jgi:hypothetical protein
MCTRYTIMLWSLSVTCGRSVLFSRYSGFPHRSIWPPRYNWNIVEHGVNHYKPNQTNQTESLIYSRKSRNGCIYVTIKICYFRYHSIELLCFHYTGSAGVSFLVQQYIALDDFSQGHSDYRAFGLMGFRTIGLLGLRIIGPSDYLGFGLLGLRTIGPSDYWDFGLLGRHPNNNVIRLSFQSNSNILLNKVHKF